MTDQPKIELPKPQGHRCFACGTANPIGLKLHFYRLGKEICSDITLARNHEGWENMAHGGIISTLLDETMSWALIYFYRTFFVTRKMDLKYVRPVLIGEPLSVAAKIEDVLRGPTIKARAELRDKNRRLLVKGSGEFAVLEADKLAAVPEGLKKDMQSLFERLG